MESTYKLYYFNGNGRAVNLRAMLTLAKANWEDCRFTFAEWPAVKSTGKFEFGQLPALEVDGKVKVQTMALEVFVARRFGFLGTNAEDEYQILNLLCSRDDFSKSFRLLIFPTEEQKSQREEIVRNLREKELPLLMSTFEKKYLENGNRKYFLGEQFSLADIFLANVFFQLFESSTYKDLFGGVPAKSCPNLAELVKRVREGEMKEFFEKVYDHTSFF